MDGHVDLILRLLEDIHRGIVLSRHRLEYSINFSNHGLSPEERTDLVSFLHTLFDITTKLRENLHLMVTLTMTDQQKEAFALEVVKNQDALEGLLTAINYLSM